VPSETINAVIDRALDAYSALGERGEAVEEEWSYVTELSDMWRARLDQVAMSHGGETAPDEISTAIDRAIAEIGQIEDEHRAIDWLSTFPQVVLLALGEAP
jgi:hypothetical protein